MEPRLNAAQITDHCASVAVV